MQLLNKYNAQLFPIFNSSFFKICLMQLVIFKGFISLFKDSDKTAIVYKLKLSGTVVFVSNICFMYCNKYS